MQLPQGARRRGKSAFAAAFLSLIFPGLGHAYAGAVQRALLFAAPPILLIALIAGVVLRVDRLELLGTLIRPDVLNAIFIANLLLLAYRVVAVIDAYQVTRWMNRAAATGDTATARPRGRPDPTSLLGVLAVIVVLAGAHVVVARYDLLASEISGSGCIFVGDSTQQCDVDGSPAPAASDDTGDEESPSTSATPEPSPVGSDVPSVSIPPWNGTDRLNILLLGIDQRPGETSFNTDTMIVVSVDPTSRQVAMFSLPRDVVDVPLPDGPIQRVYGSRYGGKINGFYNAVRNRPDFYPGGANRGYNGLKAVLGNLYGLDIKYYVQVNFEGFKRVVDAMGGVTINVQVPVVDDAYPARAGHLARVYIPAGVQHMDGDEALRYARSRHGSNDFDRGARQQRVLLSLREQADPQALVPRLPALVTALKSAVKTDIPIDQLPQLLGLAGSVDTKDIRSFVFAPPVYGTENANDPRGYVIEPNVSRIRAAVDRAFTSNPADEAQLEKLAAEGANVWVVSGTGDSTRASRLAGYLEYKGVAASAPPGRPSGAVPADTVITVYNGAEADVPDTVAFLEKTFGVTAVLKTDPSVTPDIIVTVGRSTPDLEAPPGV